MRIQSAGKCAEHSTAETGNGVVDGGGVRLAAEKRHVQTVVGCDLTVHTGIDRLRLAGQSCNAQWSLEAFNVNVRDVGDIGRKSPAPHCGPNLVGGQALELRAFAGGRDKVLS
jgi:hypothetical protein